MFSPFEADLRGDSYRSGGLFHLFLLTARVSDLDVSLTLLPERIVRVEVSPPLRLPLLHFFHSNLSGGGVPFPPLQSKFQKLDLPWPTVFWHSPAMIFLPLSFRKRLFYLWKNLKTFRRPHSLQLARSWRAEGTNMAPHDFTSQDQERVLYGPLPQLFSTLGSG